MPPPPPHHPPPLHPLHIPTLHPPPTLPPPQLFDSCCFPLLFSCTPTLGHPLPPRHPRHEPPPPLPRLPRHPPPPSPPLPTTPPPLRHHLQIRRRFHLPHFLTLLRLPSSRREQLLPLPR
ncbi:hypothetical protein PHAVU_007G252301 [Phaseolus vulgaris]